MTTDTPLRQTSRGRTPGCTSPWDRAATHATEQIWAGEQDGTEKSPLCHDSGAAFHQGDEAALHGERGCMSLSPKTSPTSSGQACKPGADKGLQLLQPGDPSSHMCFTSHRADTGWDALAASNFEPWQQLVGLAPPCPQQHGKIATRCPCPHRADIISSHHQCLMHEDRSPAVAKGSFPHADSHLWSTPHATTATSPNDEAPSSWDICPKHSTFGMTAACLHRCFVAPVHNPPADTILFIPQETNSKLPLQSKLENQRPNSPGNIGKNRKDEVGRENALNCIQVF